LLLTGDPRVVPLPGRQAAIRAAFAKTIDKKADLFVMTSAQLSLLASGAAGSPPAWTSFLPLVFMGLIFWFLILRPQMQRQKDLANKIGAIKKGDQVITGGGLLAKVIKVDENYVDLELGANVKVRALRSTIADVVSPTGSAAND